MSTENATTLLKKYTEKIAEERASRIEMLAAAYLKLTDIPADQVELVEKYDGFRVAWYFRKKGSSE